MFKRALGRYVSVAVRRAQEILREAGKDDEADALTACLGMG